MARIVVVEDEPIVARGIAKLLAANGYVVPACVGTGADAIEAAATHRPDLILMDVRLRGPMDGIDASVAIRRTADIAIVFLTAFGDREHLDRAKHAAPHGYLIKPYSDRDLLNTVEMALNRHALERELAKRERWLGTLLRSIGDGVIAVGPDLRVRSLNAVAERLTGWSDADARDRHVDEVLVLRGAVDGQVRALLEEAMHEHRVLGGEGITALVARDGRQVPVEASVAPILEDDQEVLGGVVVLRDIGERRRLEERLAASERMAALATLTAAMGHELNNPLSYNLGNLEMSIEHVRAVRDRLAAAGATSPPLDAQLQALSGCLHDALDGARRMRDVLAALDQVTRSEPGETAVPEGFRGSVPPAAPRPARPKVVVVDDDELLRRLLSQLLEEDHDVTSAGSGREALAMFAAERPDVVLCDLMMPEMTGMDLYARVAATDPALARRFVFITGGAFTDAAQAFVAAMEGRVLSKPVAPEVLFEAVARVTG